MRTRIVKFKDKFAKEVSKIILRNLKEINASEETPQEIQRLCKSYAPKEIIKSSKESPCIIAINEKNKIVGTGKLFFNYICGVYVHPDSHRQGIGSKIMSHLERQARKKRYKEVFLSTTIYALPFYKKLNYIIIPGLNDRDIIMKKVLKY